MRQFRGMEHFVDLAYVAAKTITMELDTYEKPQHANRGGESFTGVVSNDVWLDTPATAQSLRDHFHSGGSGVCDEYLNSVEEAANRSLLFPGYESSRLNPLRLSERHAMRK